MVVYIKFVSFSTVVKDKSKYQGLELQSLLKFKEDLS